MGRIAIFVYGLLAYLLFFGTFLYAIGFVDGLVVPKTIDSGPVGPVGTAVVVNVLLLGAFAVQHMIMARPAFKRWWTRIIPVAAERSTFVMAASLLLCLTFWQWRPIPTVVWDVDQPVLRAAILGVSLLGWATVLYASFLIDHFDLFGLRQVYLHLRGVPYFRRPFMERSLYRWVRHPLMTGFVIAFWAAPTMTVGHLLFAAVTTAYVLVGIKVEERDLIAAHGEDYRAYRRRTPALLPLRLPRPLDAPVDTTGAAP